MTPAARVQAAIEIFDRIEDGTPAEKALTGWARRSRFAGSKDRAAIRDHVFDALRCKRSNGWLGGGSTGRAVMLGACRGDGIDPLTIFNGVGYAPEPLTSDELRVSNPLAEASVDVRLDIPEWLWPDLERSLGDQTQMVAALLRCRAPVHLRTNTLKATREAVLERLRGDDIEGTATPSSATGIELVGAPRGLVSLEAFSEGWFELQDVASQALVERLSPLLSGATVLDYCAGGGGKALAMSAYGPERIVAHDSDPNRMSDLPARAQRAGALIEISEEASGAFDVVLCDAPCSGSGAWRRQPGAKWDLTTARLEELCAIQAEILSLAHKHVVPGGHLAYATCSLLDVENDAQIATFIADHPDWTCVDSRAFSPLEGGDGFYLAVLKAPEPQ